MSGVPGWGTLVDLSIIEKKIGRLKRFIFNDKMTLAHSLSASIVTEYGNINTAIQGASDKVNLYIDPTLALHDNPSQTT